MQLNDILEENSIKAMSTKTKISEENLEKLLAKKFDELKKIKTLGFISILEREYQADLSTLRDEAYEYYSQLNEDQSITLGMPITEEKRGTSKFVWFLIFVLIGTSTWYFFTQFDKKNLSGLIPFVDESTIENFVGTEVDESEVVEDLSISKVIEEKPNQKVDESKQAQAEEILTEDQSVVVTQSVTDLTPDATTNQDDSTTENMEISVKKSISIVPVNRLWFGIIDMDTKQRNHFSIADTYTLDVTDKRWLVATSSAPFAIEGDDEHKAFNDAKEHYFKIDAQGVTPLSKSEYVALGGWAQW